MGARASPHSVRRFGLVTSDLRRGGLIFAYTQAVLGIEAFPSDARDHPEAPLLSAGTRRQSACSTLLQQAHTLGFEHGLMDEPTVDNLAGLLALMQMITFSELQPKKSRALLRAAIGHYKELQDAATSREDADEAQRLFGLALYVCRLNPPFRKLRLTSSRRRPIRSTRRTLDVLPSSPMPISPSTFITPTSSSLLFPVTTSSQFFVFSSSAPSTRTSKPHSTSSSAGRPRVKGYSLSWLLVSC